MPELVVGGRTITFDAQDASIVDARLWHLHPTGRGIYVRGYLRGIPRRGARLEYMHRVILQAGPGQEVDHANGNGLDNRRGNLRFCTRTENNANRYAVQGKSSGHKGVYFERFTGRYRAEIMKEGKRYRLGRFNSVEQAAAAYDRKARELYPQFGHGSASSK